MSKVYYRYFNNGVAENNFILREYTWKKKGNFETKEDAIAYCAEQNDPSNPYISYFYRNS